MDRSALVLVPIFQAFFPMVAFPILGGAITFVTAVRAIVPIGIIVSGCLSHRVAVLRRPLPQTRPWSLVTHPYSCIPVVGDYGDHPLRSSGRLSHATTGPATQPFMLRHGRIPKLETAFLTATHAPFTDKPGAVHFPS